MSATPSDKDRALRQLDAELNRLRAERAPQRGAFREVFQETRRGFAEEDWTGVLKDSVRDSVRRFVITMIVLAVMAALFAAIANNWF